MGCNPESSSLFLNKPRLMVYSVEYNIYLYNISEFSNLLYQSLLMQSRYTCLAEFLNIEIMKSLISDSRMPIDDIAKEVSLSSKAVKRRLEMMRDNHIIEFSILTNLSSTQLTGYIEFAALISVDTHNYQRIVERIYEEMEEYLFYIPNSYQKEFIFAVFFCTNILQSIRY